MWIFITIIGLLKTLIIFTYLIIICKGKKVVNFPFFSIFRNFFLFLMGKFEKLIQERKKVHLQLNHYEETEYGNQRDQLETLVFFSRKRRKQ